MGARVRIRTLLGAALTVPVLIGGLVLVTAGSAAACSYPTPASEAEYAARADAVLVGALVSRVDRIDRAAQTARAELARKVGIRPYSVDQVRELIGKVARSSDRAVLTFEVWRVYKGAVGERQEIVTSPGPCARPLSGAGPFLVFAHKPSPDMARQYQLQPGQYVFSSGSRALADGGEPSLGPSAGEPGWPDSLVGVGVLAAGVAAGLGLAALRARRRASAD
jgi:hypothetical protein